MWYRFVAFAAVLVVATGGLGADDHKAKKEPEGIKGKVVKFDVEKKLIKVKTGDKEKEYPLVEEYTIFMLGGGKCQLSSSVEPFLSFQPAS